MIVSLFLACALFFFIYDWLRPDNSYDKSKPGKFYLTKYFIFLILLRLNGRRKKKSASNRKTLSDTERTNRGYGHTITDPELLESCIPLSDDPFAIDTTYFNGYNQDGISVALRVARKHNREAEVWVFLHVPGVGFFQHPLHPDTRVVNMNPVGYSAAGLRFEMLDPMTRWRVTYNGLLRRGPCNDLESKPEDFVQVKLSLRWGSINDPFNFDTDCNLSCLADAIAREKWTSEFWAKLRSKHQTHYEQIGELSGSIEIEGHETRNVHLIGMRDHTFGFRDWEMFERYAIHYIWIQETGMFAMVCVLWMPDYITYFKTGFLTYANGETFSVQDIDFDLFSSTKDDFPPDTYEFSFKAGKQSFDVKMSAVITPVLYHNVTRTSRILERFCTYTVNGKLARGNVEYHYRNPDGPAMLYTPPTSVPLLIEPSSSEIKSAEREITLSITNRACCCAGFVGGKGSQLAFLTSIQDKIFGTVPTGFCVTLFAFERQVNENSHIQLHIQQICDAIRDKKPVEQIKKVCLDTVESLASCKLIELIEQAITNQLQSISYGEKEGVSFAVRSSAADEDGGEASSAGQMESYLGVAGFDAIFDAVRKCWASAYTYQAVEYRRQHGQPIRTSVGVVIQEMVQSDVSGVLFTNNPVTGSPNKMVIDASFGLGEVVVSGKTTPDTYIVQRMFDDKLTILERRLGEKKILMQLSGGGGTEELENSYESTSKFCLTNAQVLQLCEIAIKIENYFGSSRDVEWAIKDDNIYLLQARPITTLDQDTDEDLLHEFDTPLVTGQERVTLGNIGEMMPGCVSPLTISLFSKAINLGTCAFLSTFAGGTVIKYAWKSLQITCGRLFLNMTLISQVASNSVLCRKSALETSMLGEILDDHTMDMIKSYGYENKSFISRVLRLLKFLYICKQEVVDSWGERARKYVIGPECNTATELYDEIQRKLPDYFEVWATTIMKSSMSGNMASVVMGVVSGGKEELTVENYSDVAILLAHCKDVYSAEVPTALQEIAKMICEIGCEETFMKKTDKGFVTMETKNEKFILSKISLNSGVSVYVEVVKRRGFTVPVYDRVEELRIKYCEFMDKHGHRCVREAEFLEKSWQSEPEKLMKALKAIIKSNSYQTNTKEPLGLEEAIRRLKSPVGRIGKFLLQKWIVPKTRYEVGQRELGKSVSVKIADKFKQAFWRLSVLLEAEGRLPDGVLMFFLTNREIGVLLKTRSSRLITRAVQRRKTLALQSQIEYPRLSIGRPQPVKKETSEERKLTFTICGMPISQGSVKGTARVVKSVDEAASIQAGDILVVSFTDVGWSPYFPLISGLVTEMGGLISHGAVVAREYGVPCVVNVPNATKVLKTGDHVHIEGASGQIHKLEDLTPSS